MGEAEGGIRSMTINGEVLARVVWKVDAFVTDMSKMEESRGEKADAVIQELKSLREELSKQGSKEHNVEFDPKTVALLERIAVALETVANAAGEVKSAVVDVRGFLGNYRKLVRTGFNGLLIGLTNLGRGGLAQQTPKPAPRQGEGFKQGTVQQGRPTAEPHRPRNPPLSATVGERVEAKVERPAE